MGCVCEGVAWGVLRGCGMGCVARVWHGVCCEGVAWGVLRGCGMGCVVRVWHTGMQITN